MDQLGKKQISYHWISSDLLVKYIWLFEHNCFEIMNFNGRLKKSVNITLHNSVQVTLSNINILHLNWIPRQILKVLTLHRMILTVDLLKNWRLELNAIMRRNVITDNLETIFREIFNRISNSSCRVSKAITNYIKGLGSTNCFGSTFCFRSLAFLRLSLCCCIIRDDE